MKYDPELIMALSPVVQFFLQQQIAHYIGGSVASSWHGAMRSTRDVDVVAAMKKKHARALVDELEGGFYASEPAILSAIERKSCFNLIHLATSFKVDVFVSQDRIVDRSAFERASRVRMDSGDLQLDVMMASAEDSIISKLAWYRLGNETSERQWDDLSTVFQLLGDAADIVYMENAADELGVADLLERLRTQTD